MLKYQCMIPRFRFRAILTAASDIDSTSNSFKHAGAQRDRQLFGIFALEHSCACINYTRRASYVDKSAKGYIHASISEEIRAFNFHFSRENARYHFHGFFQMIHPKISQYTPRLSFLRTLFESFVR